LKNKSGLKLLSLFLLLGLISIACMSSTLAPNSTQAPLASPLSTNGQSTNSTDSWLQVFFTNPNPPDNVGNGIDEGVVADVNNAKNSIDVTSFDLNLPSFVNALVAASQKGVRVRVVVDGENGTQTLTAKLAGTTKTFDATKTLENAGIPVINGGRSSGLMHDKIIIIDGKILYMGSWNMSYNDTFRNNNNLLRITNSTLIANYQAKFNELFVDKNFGTHAQVGALSPKLNINGVGVENYFSPVDNVMDKLVAEVQGAQKSIRFMIFTFTDEDLANAMIARYQAGVDTKGVIEDRGASEGSLVPLYCSKVPVEEDGNKYTMHHKIIIIDENTVITGSFNFTKSADHENDDNVLIIHNADLAKLYLQEFDRIWGQGKSPDATQITCK